MIDKLQMHLELCRELNEIYKKKNNDYGDSFADLRKERPDAILVLIYNKYSRLKKLLSGEKIQVENEPIVDTFLDLANYCLMEVIERKLDKCIENIATKKQ